MWSTVRDAITLSGTYNRKVFSQPGLVAAWRFNDAAPTTPSSYGSIVRDSSGHRLDGRVQSYTGSLRGSGSLAYDSPDPTISLDDPSVVTYVVNAQTSGALYDRNNESLIWKLFPGAFSEQDPVSADVFKNFALIMARHFDRIKLYIDQFVNMRRVDYGDFDQAPDALLDDLGSFLGWDPQGSFVDADALGYFLSREVTAGPSGNAGLDTRLSEIKSQFWRRTLQNLPYIYKTKGTRESVEAVLRAYGADAGFIRLKEYARRAEVRVPLERVVADKSVYALRFVSGSTVSFGG